ncbi:GNAT family N-acetyltransferase [Leptolyngbya sp. NK1-12]|uniref:GNAT family N-acetyltransferase n=1 Tax=Leptolyngbya sp. NK1-12 TaxID=2547451 RepID=A0AA96WGT9_9CYAN|nr:GNAT family N-acetyltransferase [Leptolyngbya sp. NK1-12]
MPANFTIRLAKLEDRSVLVGLMVALQETERKLHSNRTSGAEMADAHFAYLETLVREQRGQIYVAESPVAECSSGILGFVVCFVEKLDAGDLHVIESEREYGYISDLYVMPEMRMHGIGAALMQTAERHCLELNLSIVRVGLLASNEPAAKFYRKAGYQPYEVVYEKRLQE